MASGAVVVSALIGLFACQESVTEPEFARVNTRYTLTIKGDVNSAGGLITSDRGGLSCTIASSGGSASGKCSQSYKAGTIVTLRLTPAAGAALPLTAPTACPSVNETQGSTCEVLLDQNKSVTFKFERQSSTFALTVSGGAAGSGRVTSNTGGIDCSITDGGAASTGCTASYSLNTVVTLTAVAGTGSYLKAWAGGGCDANGTGGGQSTGVCTVTMSQALAVIVSFDRPANASLLGEWKSPFTWPGLAIHANLLPDGRVFTWGRSDRRPVLWNPATNAFSSVSEPSDLFCSGHALLPDGRLLVSGGHSGIDNQGILATQIFDYSTDTWVTPPPPNMQNGRWYPSVLALPSGEMLTIAGGDTMKATNRIPEVWTSGFGITARPLPMERCFQCHKALLLRM